VGLEVNLERTEYLVISVSQIEAYEMDKKQKDVPILSI
jgi:hypothetical protein